MQGGLVEPTVVLDPAPKDWVPHVCQVVDGFVAPQINPPAPHFLSHPLRRVVADGGGEVHEELWLSCTFSGSVAAEAVICGRAAA